MIKGFQRIEMEVQIRKFRVQKGEKNQWNEPVFKGTVGGNQERAGPLNQGSVPLIIMGAAWLIKGAAPPERCPALSFCEENFSGLDLPFLVENLKSYIYNDLNIFF